MQQEYYALSLYPLQDQVLRLLESAGSSFYLTGGTALSRAWLHHRYSDDLDFFLNQDPNFTKEVTLLLDLFTKEYGSKLQRLIDTAGFHRWVITEGEIHLKIELIDDVGYRSGSVIKTPLYYKTDSLENIASNKISALSRNEPKDMADLLFIEKLASPDWPSLVEEAKMKDVRCSMFGVQC